MAIGTLVIDEWIVVTVGTASHLCTKFKSHKSMSHKCVRQLNSYNKYNTVFIPADQRLDSEV